MKTLEISEVIKAEVEKILALSEDYILSNDSAYEIERGLLSSLLSLGFVLLNHILTEKSKQLREFVPSKTADEVLKSKGYQLRSYQSIFGLLKIERFVYWSKERGNYAQLDEELSLPSSRSWSYLLQELVSQTSSLNDFSNSVSLLNSLLGLNLSGKSSQRNANHLGPKVEEYYADKEVEKEEGSICFSVGFDGKGVPKIKDAQPKSGNPKRKLGKGEKRGVKQMATVSVTSCFVPKKRNKSSVLRSLMGTWRNDKSKKELANKQEQVDNGWHQKIHRRAFLADQPKAVEYGLNYIKERMVNPQSRFVIPIDAGPGLEEKILAYVKEHQMESQFDGIILDIIHVSEYVWDAANALFNESSKLRQDWVKKMFEDLLDSKTEKVIKDLKNIRNKLELEPNKVSQIDKTITYFSNHKGKMNYKLFLEKGYPVSSALAESTCKHLVKDRMEKSGMRWSSQGAQNMLDLRAVNINGDNESFIKFVAKKERNKMFDLAA